MSNAAIKIGDLDIPYRFSARAKLLSVRVTGKGAEIIIPRHNNLKQAISFLHGKPDWLREHLPVTVQKISIEHGTVIPVLGDNLKVNHNSSTAGIAHISGKFIEVYGPAETVAINVRYVLHKLLLDKTRELVAVKTAQLGVQASVVKVKKLESMWGNCSRNKVITIATSLVHTPPQVLEYVVSHEVSHLLHMNHSREFWDTVTLLMPDYRAHRKWLKDNQSALGAWR